MTPSTPEIREIRPFPPVGPYEPGTSGLCYRCGAVIVGTSPCPSCGEARRVQASDEYLAGCADFVRFDARANGPSAGKGGPR